MPTQVVVSRIQNRRGTQAEFDSLYVPGAPDEQKLQPGEIGLCMDTGRLFIGTDLVDEPLEIAGVPTPTDLEFTPVTVDLPASATWVSISQLSYEIPISTPNTVGLLDILYSLELISPATFSKNGTLSVTSLGNTATLTDTGVDINTATGDIYFKAISTLGMVQIQYTHNFPGIVRMSSGTLKWIPF